MVWGSAPSCAVVLTECRDNQEGLDLNKNDLCCTECVMSLTIAVVHPSHRSAALVKTSHPLFIKWHTHPNPTVLVLLLLGKFH